MKTNTHGREAVLHYSDAHFTVRQAGDFVRCAVTGRAIPLIELRYWNPTLQEPYADAATAVARWRELNAQ